MNKTQHVRFPGATIGRRRFLGGLAISFAAVAGSPSVIATPAPKETGLSFEGLLSGRSGFQPRKPMSLPVAELPGFLSRAQLNDSYTAYRSAFDELVAAEKNLQGDVRGTLARHEYATLRSRQVGSANAVLLHEFYFRNLADKPTGPSRYLRSNMSEHIGSFQAWRDDFVACASVAEAWVVLVYDPYDDRWHNLPLGVNDAGGMVGANPLVVCSVAESAWKKDYASRDEFIAKFLEHIDWNIVASRYRAVDRQ